MHICLWQRGCARFDKVKFMGIGGQSVWCELEDHTDGGRHEEGGEFQFRGRRKEKGGRRCVEGTEEGIEILHAFDDEDGGA